MFSSIIALVIMFFIGRAVLKWARNESKREAEAINDIVNYLKEEKASESDSESPSQS